MATIPSESESQAHRNERATVETWLRIIEERVDRAADQMAEEAYFAQLGEDMRNLHARLRIHHTQGFRGECVESEVSTRPELVDTLSRLMAERPRILGDLDRLIRASGSIADRALEDRDVFILRVKELMAFLRRHQAEEEQLLFLTAWHDTGGES